MDRYAIVEGCHNCPHKKQWKELWCDKMEPLQKIAFYVHNLTFHPDCPLCEFPSCEKQRKIKMQKKERKARNDRDIQLDMLLHCVETKYSDETRFETALRYIKERESAIINSGLKNYG